jgi:hypothetical protein
MAAVALVSYAAPFDWILPPHVLGWWPFVHAGRPRQCHQQLKVAVRRQDRRLDGRRRMERDDALNRRDPRARPGSERSRFSDHDCQTSMSEATSGLVA